MMNESLLLSEVHLCIPENLHTTQSYAALVVLEVYLKSKQEQGKPQGAI